MTQAKISREDLEQLKKEFVVAIKQYREELDRIEKNCLQKIEKIKKGAFKVAEDEEREKTSEEADKLLEDI